MCYVTKILPIECSLPRHGEDDVGSLCGPGHGGLKQLGVLALHLIPALVLGTLQVDPGQPLCDEHSKLLRVERAALPLLLHAPPEQVCDGEPGEVLLGIDLPEDDSVYYRVWDFLIV